MLTQPEDSIMLQHYFIQQILFRNRSRQSMPLLKQPEMDMILNQRAATQLCLQSLECCLTQEMPRMKIDLLMHGSS